MLAKAAVFGELDKMTGVSANIMFGQEVPSGTGFVEVLFDEEKYLGCLSTIDEEHEVVPNQEQYDEDYKTDMYCSENNFDFAVKI